MELLERKKKKFLKKRAFRENSTLEKNKTIQKMIHIQKKKKQNENYLYKTKYIKYSYLH